MATKKSSSSKGQGKVKKVMREYKQGALKSGKGGKGGKVKSRKQAVAIGLSEARAAGAKIPKKKAAAKKKGTATKKKAAAKKKKLNYAAEHSMLRFWSIPSISCGNTSSASRPASGC